MNLRMKARAELVYAEAQVTRCETDASVRGDRLLAHLLRMARLEIETQLGRRKPETLADVIDRM